MFRRLRRRSGNTDDNGQDTSPHREQIQYDAPSTMPHYTEDFSFALEKFCPRSKEELPGAAPEGACPSGTMEIALNADKEFPGCKHGKKSVAVIEISYDIPSGKQLSYHMNPGKSFKGTRRTAYLPDSLEGQRTLSRFRYAWEHGLMFEVGTSATTGEHNVVVWSSSVPQKSSLNGGAFGFPDESYIDTINAKLDEINVPDADICRSYYQLPDHGVHGEERIERQAPKQLSESAFATGILEHSSSPLPSLSLQLPPIPPPAAAPDSRNPSFTTISGSAPSAPGSGNQVITSVPALCTDLSMIRRASAPPAPMGLSDQNCAVCCESLSNDEESVRIKACNHVFHSSCIENCLKNSHKRCPVCRILILGEPQGTSPSGTMTIEVKPRTVCLGFQDNPGTIEILYEIPSGIQHQYHTNPGMKFEGTTRVAYLPFNAEGSRLLSRLKYAWKHGLVFTIGRSATTGQDNVVTWGSIHHKTSLEGGPYGFPDESYIRNCQESLDALGVPDADYCNQAS